MLTIKWFPFSFDYVKVSKICDSIHVVIAFEVVMIMVRQFCRVCGSVIDYTELALAAH